MTDQPSPPKTPTATPISPEAVQQQQMQQVVQAALRGPTPRFYANGFAIAASASDLSVVLMFNQSPLGILSMSYTAAQSLVGDLGTAIKNYETATEQRVQAIREIHPKLQNIARKNNAPRTS